MADSKTSSRVPEFDGVRGVAILLVVFEHFVWMGSAADGGGFVLRVIRFAFPLGWTGVDLFFVLSGFLLGGILMDHRGSANYFKVFYIRRFCRIFPLYYLWLGLTLLLLGWLFPARSGPGWWAAMFENGDLPGFPKWGYALFLQNFWSAKTYLFGPAWLMVTWSLAVEEHFYILLPLALRYLIPRKPIGTLICVIALVPLFRTFLFLRHPEIFVYVLSPCRADALLLGVLCAYLVRDEGWRRRLECHRDRLYLVFTILFLGMIYLTVLAKGRTMSSIDSFEMVTFGFSWIALFYACFLVIVATHRTGPMAGLMRVGLLRHFGIIAYGIYLIHLPLLHIAFGLILGTHYLPLTTFTAAAITLLAFLVTWLLAALSWNFLERPIIRWGHSFTYTSPEAASEPVPANPVASL